MDDGGAGIDHIEPFHHMVLLAIEIGRHAGDIFTIHLPIKRHQKGGPYAMNARFCAQVQDLGAQFGGPAMDELTLVRIDNGMVRGTAEGDLVTFKGIPFAQPPVGASSAHMEQAR